MNSEWLTYVEAAERLGIKTDSVKRRARARHWPRRTTNSGLVQVAIPADALPDDRPDIRTDDPPTILPENPLPSAPDQLHKYAIEAAMQRARADALSEQITDLKTERDRLLTIVESYASRPVDTRPRGFFDNLGRFFKR